jgi:hypothetical protein
MLREAKTFAQHLLKPAKSNQRGEVPPQAFFPAGVGTFSGCIAYEEIHTNHRRGGKASSRSLTILLTPYLINTNL